MELLPYYRPDFALALPNRQEYTLQIVEWSLLFRHLSDLHQLPLLIGEVAQVWGHLVCVVGKGRKKITIKIVFINKKISN